MAFKRNDGFILIGLIGISLLFFLTSGKFTGVAIYDRPLLVRPLGEVSGELGPEIRTTLKEGILFSGACAEIDNGLNFRKFSSLDTTERGSGRFLRNDVCVSGDGTDILREFSCGRAFNFKSRGSWQFRNDIALGLDINCKDFYGLTSVCVNGACTREPFATVNVPSISRNVGLTINEQDTRRFLFSSADNGFIGVHSLSDPPRLLRTLEIKDSTGRSPLLGKIAVANRKFYVVGKFGSAAQRVFIINPKNGIILREIPFSSDLGDSSIGGDIIYSRVNNRIYAVNQDSTEILVIDPTNDNNNQYSLAPHRGYTLAMSPSEDKVYVFGNYFYDPQGNGTLIPDPAMILFDTTTNIVSIIRTSMPPASADETKTINDMFVNPVSGVIHLSISNNLFPGTSIARFYSNGNYFDTIYLPSGTAGWRAGALSPNGKYLMTNYDIFDRWATSYYGEYWIYGIPSLGRDLSQVLFTDNGARAFVTNSESSELQQIKGFIV